jgi:hypothetical protein
MSVWCEVCRDNFDVEHFTEDGMAHLKGVEYGPTGERMARLEALEWLLAEARYKALQVRGDARGWPFPWEASPDV